MKLPAPSKLKSKLPGEPVKGIEPLRKLKLGRPQLPKTFTKIRYPGRHGQ